MAETERPTEVAELIRQAEALALARNWGDEAETVNAAIIGADPTNPSAHTRLAKVLLERGDTDGATEIYHSVLSFDPENRIANNYLTKVGRGRRSTKVERVKEEAMQALLTSARAATRFGKISDLGTSSHKWPAGNVEDYEMGWEVHADIGSSRQVAIQHRLGFRDVWGDENKRRGVTFAAGVPAVEGTACDDYSRSRALVSVLKRSSGQHVQTRYELPGGYQGFTIVRHDDEIDAKGTYTCLALKLLEDDVLGWATHALLRSLMNGTISWEEAR